MNKYAGYSQKMPLKHHLDGFLPILHEKAEVKEGDQMGFKLFGTNYAYCCGAPF